MCLDLFFPKNALVREIEAMAVVEFVGGRRFHGTYPPECAGWVHTLLTYRDHHVRAAMWELKYRKNTKVAKLFAAVLAEDLEKQLKERPEEHAKNPSTLVIVPIPLSEKRRRERGYNQIELILEQLPKNECWTIATNLLRRKHHTIPQTKLPRAERLKNLEDCFEVSEPQRAVEERLVIIDDVLTTGSTVRQAREAMLRAGANEVTAITLAH